MPKHNQIDEIKRGILAKDALHEMETEKLQHQPTGSFRNLFNSSDEAIRIIRDFLDDPVPLICTARRFHGLFKYKVISTVLSCVVQGNQNKVAQLSNPLHFLSKGDVTDCSGRKFKSISAYQYALWALDKHMERMIVNKVRNAKGSDVDTIKTKLLTQWRELKNSGIRYILNGQEYIEVEYDPKPLLDAYQSYMTLWSSNPPWAHVVQAWYDIGMQQRLLPAHAIQEMCTPQRSFYPTPTFKEKSLDRTFKFTVYLSGRGEASDSSTFPWRSSDTQDLRVNFTLVRSNDWIGAGASAADNGRMSGPVNQDRDAFMALFKVRQAELELEPDLSPSPDSKPKYISCVLS